MSVRTTGMLMGSTAQRQALAARQEAMTGVTACQAHTHTHSRHTHTESQPQTQKHTHTYTHTYTHIHTHTHTLTHEELRGGRRGGAVVRHGPLDASAWHAARAW